MEANYLEMYNCWLFLLRRLPEPLAEVFFLHDRRAPGAVQAESAYRPGGILIVGDRLLNRKGGHAYGVVLV